MVKKLGGIISKNRRENNGVFRPAAGGPISGIIRGMKQNNTAQSRFRAIAPRRLELAAALRLLPLGELPHMACLDVGAPDPVFSRELRARGGAWRTVARSPAHAKAASVALGEAVGCLGADGSIPLPDHSFDAAVVALDILAAMPDALAFSRECNRVLKPSGLLVLSVQAKRAFSLPDSIRRRRFPDALDPYASDFTESSVYNLLKNGFDVQQLVTWSRLWVELVRLREQRLIRAGAGESEIAARTGTLYRVAEALDAPLFWARGHVMTLSARRRRWSDRMAPVLSDGRTICEAVLFNPPA